MVERDLEKQTSSEFLTMIGKMAEEIESLRSQLQQHIEKKEMFKKECQEWRELLRQAEQERDYVKEELEFIRPMVDVSLHGVREVNTAMREALEKIAVQTRDGYTVEFARSFLSRYTKEGEIK